MQRPHRPCPAPAARQMAVAVAMSPPNEPMWTATPATPSSRRSTSLVIGSSVQRTVEVGVFAEAPDLAVADVEDVDRAVLAWLAALMGSVSAYDNDDEVVAEFAETLHGHAERVPCAAHEVE